MKAVEVRNLKNLFGGLQAVNAVDFADDKAGRLLAIIRGIALSLGTAGFSKHPEP